MLLIGNPDDAKERPLMLWVVPAPDLAPLPLDLRPVATEVRSFDEKTAAGSLRAMADKLASIIRVTRPQIAAGVRIGLAMVARAELEGWEVNVDVPIKALSDALSQLQKSANELKTSVRGTVSSMHAARIPGGNTLHISQQKIEGIITSVANDLEDYLEEFKAVKDRMRIYKTETPPINRAADAYEYAFKKVFGEDKIVVREREEVDGAMTLRVLVSLPDELLSDTENLLKSEKEVHDKVALEDNSFVGKVAIDYLPVRQVQ